MNCGHFPLLQELHGVQADVYSELQHFRKWNNSKYPKNVCNYKNCKNVCIYNLIELYLVNTKHSSAYSFALFEYGKSFNSWKEKPEM